MTAAHYDDSSDDKLILRLQRGETSAYEPLIEKHLRHVRLFAALKSPSFEAVEDITRDTFVVAFQNIAEFTVGLSFRAWLRAIAWDLVRSDIKRRLGVTDKSSRYAHARLVEFDRESAPVYETDEVELFEDCLRELPDAMREIFELKYSRDFSNEQICAETQRKMVWVRTAMFRARQQLRNCISQKAGRPADAQ